ncbi:hypothetical protein KCU93_g4368, partial [Aureobasidium melanogenum]
MQFDGAPRALISRSRESAPTGPPGFIAAWVLNVNRGRFFKPEQHNGLLKYLAIVLNFFTWLATHQAAWRNPLLANAYLGFSLYQNFYAITYERLFNRYRLENEFEFIQPYKNEAIAVWAIFGILTLLTVLPWYYVFLTGNIRARWFVRSPDFTMNKSIMQVDPRNGYSIMCRHCPKRHVRGNRWYFANHNRIAKCLPLYDHTCDFLCAPIYLHNMKAYILTVTMFPLYQAATFILSVWAISKREHDFDTKSAIAAFSISLALLPFVVKVTYRALDQLLTRNIMAPEAYETCVRIRQSPDSAMTEYRTFEQGARVGPYTRSRIENLRSIFGWNGSWWLAPFWLFLEPPMGQFIWSEDDEEGPRKIWEPEVYRLQAELANAEDAASFLQPSIASGSSLPLSMTSAIDRRLQNISERTEPDDDYFEV